MVRSSTSAGSTACCTSPTSSYKRVNHPSEVLNIGDTVKVQIIRINRETQRISLGMKQLESDPWEGAAAKYPIGGVFRGRVTNITEYGAFVELEPGIEGLVHVSEMSWTKKNVHPGKIVSTSARKSTSRCSRSTRKSAGFRSGLKQAQENPWAAFAEKHPVGSTVEGEVKNATEFGLFIGLDGDVDGMVHMSDIAWGVSGEEALQLHRKGETVKAQVLDVDVEKERISLGMKQLEGGGAGARLPEASAAAAQASRRATSSRLPFVRCRMPVSTCRSATTARSGSSSAATLAATATSSAPERFQVGQKFDAMVSGFDRSKKPNFSIKAMQIAEEKQAVAQYGSSDSGASLGDILGQPEGSASGRKPPRRSNQVLQYAAFLDGAPRKSFLRDGRFPDSLASQAARVMGDWGRTILEAGTPMIRSELVQKLCTDFPDLTQREVEGVVSAIFDSITDQLAKGGRVELRGFGAFSTRQRDGRVGPQSAHRRIGLGRCQARALFQAGQGNARALKPQGSDRGVIPRARTASRADVAEPVDAGDLKSSAPMGVRVRSPAVRTIIARQSGRLPRVTILQPTAIGRQRPGPGAGAGTAAPAHNFVPQQQFIKRSRLAFPPVAVGTSKKASNSSSRVVNARRDAVVLIVLITAVMLLIWNGSTFFSNLPMGDARFGPAIRLASTALTLNVALILFGWRRYVDLQHEAEMRAEHERRATVLATTDTITGLFNRKGFAGTAGELVRRSRRARDERSGRHLFPDPSLQGRQRPAWL